MKTRLFRMNPFICVWSTVISSLYLQSLGYNPLQLFWFSQFLVVFPPPLQSTLQNWSSGMPEYFEDLYAMPSCNSVVKELMKAISWCRDWLVFIFWELTASNLQLDVLTNFNTACSFVSLHRQLETRLFSTQTHCTNQSKQERRLKKWPNKSRHSFTPTKGCLWPPVTFQIVIILTWI